MSNVPNISTEVVTEALVGLNLWWNGYGYLMIDNALSTFEKNLSLETGLEFAGENTSVPAFLRSGLTSARLYLDGKPPVALEWFIIRAMKRASSGAASLIINVGVCQENIVSLVMKH